MNQVLVNLPDDLQHFVASEVTTGNYNSPAGYIEALIARAKSARLRTDSLLAEGLDSGEQIPLDKGEWARIRADVNQQLSRG